jgi:Sulfotransferase family
MMPHRRARAGFPTDQGTRFPTLHVVSHPIIVTGSHRSGTTWTGALLGFSGEALPIHEPFNPAYPRSWFADPPARWFEAVAPDDAERAAQMQRIVDLRPPVMKMAARSARPRHLARVAQEAARALEARLRGRRALLKDPIAFFSVEWLADTFDADVIILVRHPAAFASSLKRLSWQFDFTNLTSQPAVMASIDDALADEVRSAARHGLEIIDTSTLLWRVVNSIAARHRERHPDWTVVRYEDLAADPLEGFESLYSRVGLTWSQRAADAVRGHTSGDNATEVADGDKGGIVRDSTAAMWTWRDRLTDAEIERVKSATGDVWREFYDEADWTPPA